MKLKEYFNQGEDGPSRRSAWLYYPFYELEELLVKLGIVKEDQL